MRLQTSIRAYLLLCVYVAGFRSQQDAEADGLGLAPPFLHGNGETRHRASADGTGAEARADFRMPVR